MRPLFCFSQSKEDVVSKIMAEFSRSTKYAFACVISLLLLYFIYAIVVTVLGAGDKTSEKTTQAPENSEDSFVSCPTLSETSNTSPTTPSPSPITPYEDENPLEPEELATKITLQDVIARYRTCNCCQCHHKDIHINACFIDILDVTDPDDVAFLFFFEVSCRPRNILP